jgi:hypothetical protein
MIPFDALTDLWRAERARRLARFAHLPRLGEDGNTKDHENADDDEGPVLVTEGKDAMSDNSVPPVPAYKRDAVRQDSWRDFNGAMRDGGFSPAQQFAYGETFAAEGGMSVNSQNGATAGITRSTLNAAKNSGTIPGLDAVHSPSDLSPAQVAAIYQFQTDRNFGTVGGANALNNVGNQYAAAALADTLFWEGSGDGAQTVQQAINRAIVNSGSSLPGVAEDGKMGPGTLGAYTALSQDPTSQACLLDALAFERIAWGATQPGPIDTTRIDHFRFVDRR